MNSSLELIIAATILGGVWRVMLGGWLSLPRSALIAVGAIMAAAITWFTSGDYIVVGLSALLTLGYFTIGNSAVLGQRGSLLEYLRIYVAPTVVAGITLWLGEYYNLVAMAGPIAALGYYLLWQPFDPNASPWNIKAEAIMGASWFGLLAVNLG